MASNREACGVWIVYACVITLLANSAVCAAQTSASKRKTATAVYGTPKIDATIDPIWKKAEVLVTDRRVSGVSTVPASAAARAKVRTMWDKDHMYILCEVKDGNLSAKGGDGWNHDSVEIFLDENNGKAGRFEMDDCQYRVNYKGATDGGQNYEAANLVARAREVDDGYIIEMAIKLRTTKGKPGNKLGFDVQVNDDPGTGMRQSIMKWSDATDRSYHDTSRWGTLVLAKELKAKSGKKTTTSTSDNKAPISDTNKTKGTQTKVE